MRTIACVTALALLACGNEPPVDNNPTTRVSPIARDGTLSVRCVLRDAYRERSPLAPRESTIAVGSPAGAFWLTSAWLLRDDARVASVFGAAESAAMTDGQRWLSYQRGALYAHETAMDTGRAVRSLPQACDVRMISTSGGAFVAYRRSARGCVGGESQGPIVLLRVSQNGQQIDTFSPFSDTPFVALDARLDNGRVVLDARAANTGERSVVVDLDATVLAQHDNGALVCPLSGCVFVALNNGSITFAPPSATNNAGAWSLSIAPGALRSVAAYADRVLVVTQENSGPRYSMVLIDAARRRVESLYDPRLRAAADLFTESLVAGTLRVAATDSGFALIGGTTDGQLFAREIDCEP